MRISLVCLTLIFSGLPLFAKVPDGTVRPVARAQAEAPVILRPKLRPLLSPTDTDEIAKAIIAVRLRPSLRPPSEQMLGVAERPEGLPFASPEISSRPWLRPDGILEKAMAKRRLRRKGAVCGDIDIQGEEVGYVPGRISACGIKDAVKIRAVSGISLSQEALVNCRTANALKKWIEKGVEPAFRGNPVVKLKVAAHYACRTRNNRPGAKISEHGKGNAIDISAFTLRDGKVLTVLNNWGNKAIRKVHRAACGPFGTVLGPNADRYHKDHFHFDVARHRGGPYCR
ncbi:MAG: extensin family protein [Sedimentitalea sp.]